eukprot:scaffold105121_cov51-Prasinocladus_malaysianus.AAC.1
MAKGPGMAIYVITGLQRRKWPSAQSAAKNASPAQSAALRAQSTVNLWRKGRRQRNSENNESSHTRATLASD